MEIRGVRSDSMDTLYTCIYVYSIDNYSTFEAPPVRLKVLFKEFLSLSFFVFAEGNSTEKHQKTSTASTASTATRRIPGDWFEQDIQLDLPGPPRDMDRWSNDPIIQPGPTSSNICPTFVHFQPVLCDLPIHFIYFMHLCQRQHWDRSLQVRPAALLHNATALWRPSGRIGQASLKSIGKTWQNMAEHAVS